MREAIDTTTPGGRLIFYVFGALAEFEADLIRERTRVGLAAARANGGRLQALSAAQTKCAQQLYEAKELAVEEIAQALGVSRATIYRAVRT